MLLDHNRRCVDKQRLSSPTFPTTPCSPYPSTAPKPHARQASVTLLHHYKRCASVTLLDHYKRCVEKQREKYNTRRTQAMGTLGPLNFSHQERKGIRKEVVQRIRELNMLDSELLDFARQVFKQQQLAYADMIKAVMEEWPMDNNTDNSHIGRRRRLSSPYASPRSTAASSSSSSSSRMFTRGGPVSPAAGGDAAASGAADSVSPLAGDSSSMLQQVGDRDAAAAAAAENDDGDDDGYGDDNDCMSYAFEAVAGQASSSL
ncbi:unnamed protein product [Closterium sp. NIES-53]